MPLDSWTARIEPTLGPAGPADAGELTSPDVLADSFPDPIPRDRAGAGEPESGLAEDPVAMAADAAFARLGTLAALNAELETTRAFRPPTSKEPAPDGPDWTPQLLQHGRSLHALMGLDDPLMPNPSSSYDETSADLELRAALEQLPDFSLASGELAALDAFDMALGEGADMEEALSAAIAAAEAVGGPDWAEPRQDRFLAPTPDLTSDRQPNLRPGEFELAGEASLLGARSGDGGRPAADPAFDIRVNGFYPPTGASETGALDPAFGVGFQFGDAGAESDAVLDFERRINAERDTSRHDTSVTVTAAGSALAGSADADFLVGGSGIDIIGARAGDDYLFGDTPSNYDSAAHDIATPLTSPTFADTGGADIISGGAGDDSLWGGAGDDRMHGDIPDSGTSLADEFGFDLGSAGFGDDALWGGAGADELWGGEGNDTLYGEAGVDSLYGGEGNDTLYGGDDADRLEGNDGVDTLYGQAGGDNLFGYAGDDVLAGGEGDDTLSGGTGADEFRFAGGSGADALAHASSLGVDTINDYSAADGDVFGLSDADFGFGAAGNLLDGDTYFEYAATTLSGAPLDASGGDGGPAMVVFGSNTGNDGVDLYYTDDASAMTNANSYQIADIIGVNMTDVEAGDFFLRS